MSRVSLTVRPRPPSRGDSRTLVLPEEPGDFRCWWKDGTPEWIRTTDLLLRRQTLYPAELRAHGISRLYPKRSLRVQFTTARSTTQPGAGSCALLRRSGPCPRAGRASWFA